MVCCKLFVTGYLFEIKGDGMATIYEVAKHAGVSVATVSRVINKKGYVKESTRQKVETSIEKLEYTPNSIARKLFNKTTNTIGFLIPDIGNPFFPELYKQLEKYGEKVGCNILLFNSNYDEKREEKFLDLMHSKIIDAAIIVSDSMTAEQLDGLSFPIITLDRRISEKISSVTVDNYGGARQAVSYLASVGSQSIAHITGPRENFTALERFRGYQDEIFERGLKSMVTVGDYTIQEAVNATEELFTLYPKVDGIFASNDLIALGVVKTLTKKGVDLNKLNLIGFDGIRLGTGISPEISTLVQPIEKIAKSAINLLLNNGEEIQHIMYEVELLRRDT